MKKTRCVAILLGTLCFAPNAEWVQTSGPSEHTVLSLAVQDSFLFAGTYSGAYFSTDNGDQWSQTGSLPFPGSRVLSLAVMGSLVFAGTDAGVCRSSDHGKSWSVADSGMPDRSLIHSLAVDGANVYAGTHAHGVFRTADSGITWTAIDSGMPATTSVYSLTVSGGQVVAGTWGAGIYRLSNNQSAWSAANSGMPANAKAGYALSLAATAVNIVAGMGSTVYVSSDGGGSWAGANSPLMQSDVNGLAAEGNDAFAATYSSGVFHSGDNGISWVSISEGLPPTNSQGLCVAVKGTYLFLGSGNSGVWRRPLSEISAVKKQHGYQLRQTGFTVRCAAKSTPLITIGFSLPHTGRVLVRTYSLSGSTVSVIVDKRCDAGTYRFTVDARRMAAGTYCAEFIGEDFTTMQRFTVIR